MDKPCLTGEKLWLDRGSNLGFFADRAKTLPLSYRATRLYQQLFTLTLTGYTLHRAQIFLWGNPRISYILPWRTYRLNHLTTVGYLCWEPFVTGEKLWLDRSMNPGSFADRGNTLPLSLTEPPGHITNNFSS